MAMQIQERLSWGKYATFAPAKREPVYNWLYYKEAFSPQLVKAIMSMMELEDKSVVCTPAGCVSQDTLLLDPFCGIGTTLLAAKQRGIKSLGFDVMPIAVLASRAKTNKYDAEKLKEVAKEISAKKVQESAGPQPSEPMPANEQAAIEESVPVPEIVNRAFPKKSLDELVNLRALIGKIENVEIRDFMLLTLVSAAMDASWAYKDGEVIKVKKKSVPPLRKSLERTLRRMIRDTKKIRLTDAKIEAKQGDARFLGLEDGSVHAVITSPPYLNQIDYTRAYAIENWIVSGKTETEARFLGKEQDGRWSEKKYFEDIRMVLQELWRVCAPGAKLAFVIGNAWMDEKEVECDARLAEIGQEVGFEPERLIVLNIRPALKKRTEKVGSLRESVVIFRKPEAKKTEE